MEISVDPEKSGIYPSPKFLFSRDRSKTETWDNQSKTAAYSR